MSTVVRAGCVVALALCWARAQAAEEWGSPIPDPPAAAKPRAAERGTEQPRPDERGSAEQPRADVRGDAEQPGAEERGGADATASGAPAGEWTYTDEYGWVWVPYSSAYAQAPRYRSGVSYVYLYGPAFGWGWVAAPWGWDVWAWPYFGLHGYAGWYGRGWYGRGWYGWPGWAGRGWYGPGWRGRPWAYRGAPSGGWGRHWGGTSPAPRRSAPAPGGGARAWRHGR